MKNMLTALMLSILTLSTASYGVIQIGSLKIDHCWVRPAQERGNTAAYLIVDNDQLVEDKLVSAECVLANRVELHNHIHENGVMKMRPVAHVDIKDKQTEMKPGGLHIMLMGLKQELKENDKVAMKLTFEKAGSVMIEFNVKKPN